MNTFELSIEDGEFLLADANGAITCPEAAQLIRALGRPEIRNSMELPEIAIHRRPSFVRYSSKYLAGQIVIAPTFLDTPVLPIELERIGRLGYLLRQGHLYFFNHDVRDAAKRFARINDAASKLKFLASLSADQLERAALENLPEQVLVQDETGAPPDIGSLYVPLYPYQQRGLDWLLYCFSNGLGTVLADDMGLGKTAQIIALIARLSATGLLSRSLIVVPNTLIDNWIREFEFFYGDIKPFVHAGSIRTGLSENLLRETVTIVPYSIMTNDIGMLEELDLDLLVFDEASLLKNPDSQRTRAALRLKSFMTVAVTGTPVENSLLDLWSITNLVSPEFLGPKEKFESDYCQVAPSDALTRDLEVIETKVSNILLRRMKVDVLEDLPAKIDIHQPITMSQTERDGYEQICQEIRSDHTNRQNVLALISRLRKFTTHPALLDDETDPSLASLKAVSAKFGRLFDLINEALIKNEKVLVFANHVRMLDILVRSIVDATRCPAFKIDGTVPPGERQGVVDKFSNISGGAVLCLNPVTAGMGLNITAANHVIHYSRQWNPALEMQATARAFRNGQTKDVNVYYLYYANSIEEIIDQRLRDKLELSSRVVNTVENLGSEDGFYLKELTKMQRTNK